MSKNEKVSLLEQFEDLIISFNEIKNGIYLGTLNKSRDVVIGLTARGTNFIKKIAGENSEYFKSIKETKHSNIRDKFLHVRGVLKALYEEMNIDMESYLTEKSIDKKDFIINTLEEFINEVESFGSNMDRLIWLKRVIKFISNELPSSKRYKDFENLFSQFLEGFPKYYGPTTIERNGIKILTNLVSFVKEDNFDIYYINLHEKVSKVSLKLFNDGHYSQAVYETVKVLNNYVKAKAGITDKDLSGAMAKAFNEQHPIIKLSDLKTQSDKDEQEGFKFLFMGAMKGIRNPMGHETYEIDRDTAIEYLAFLSLLFRRAEEGIL